jgi:hypothetical protein
MATVFVRSLTVKLNRQLGRRGRDDPSFSPHVKTAELAAAFGVSEATMHAKARFIEKALSVNVLDPQWTTPSRIEHNPLTWMAEVGGLIVDLRAMPRDVQEQAFDAG